MNLICAVIGHTEPDTLYHCTRCLDIKGENGKWYDFGTAYSIMHPKEWFKSKHEMTDRWRRFANAVDTRPTTKEVEQNVDALKRNEVKRKIQDFEAKQRANQYEAHKRISKEIIKRCNEIIDGVGKEYAVHVDISNQRDFGVEVVYDAKTMQIIDIRRTNVEEEVINSDYNFTGYTPTFMQTFANRHSTV